MRSRRSLTPCFALGNFTLQEQDAQALVGTAHAQAETAPPSAEPASSLRSPKSHPSTEVSLAPGNLCQQSHLHLSSFRS